MKDNFLISIIVPCYNVEKYIEKCTNSLINQSYKNIEIILVDDGSTDNTGDICDNLKKKDKRINVIHIHNSGVSNARNIGIKQSKGNYIAFVDSDDYIELNMYEEMVSIINSKELPDIVSSGFIYETEKGQKFACSKKSSNKIDILNKKEAFEEIFSGRIGAYIWNKLFRKDLLLSNNLLFDIDISSGEDLLFLCQVIESASKIYHINKDYYHYIKRNDSITNSQFNEKLLSILKAFDKIENITNRSFNNSKESFKFSKSFAICNLIYKMYNQKRYQKETKELNSWLKQNRKLFLIGNYPDKKVKVISILLSINVSMGCTIWSIYKKIRNKKYS